jgi:hypothetical protein
VNLPGDHVSQAPYFVKNVAESPRYEEGRLTVPQGVGWGLGELDLTEETETS